MPTLAIFVSFAVATAAVLLVPGPSVAYVVARGLEGGPRAALYSVLGLETGAALHVLAAAGGLAALVASTSWGFTVVRWAGAGYLVHLGIRQLRSRQARAQAGALEHSGGRVQVASRRRLFRDGVLVDLLNPKTAIFFLAFLPQFVDPVRGAVASQVGVLGATFVLLAFVVDGSYGALAGRLSRTVMTGSLLRDRIDRGTGVVYLGLAGFAVFA